MEKIVGAFEVRRTFGKMLQDILTHGDRFIVERHGQPVAVVVSLDLYEQWKRNRARFFEKLQAAQTQANLAPDEADTLAQEAVQAARQ